MLTKKISLLALPFVALVGCGGDDGKAPPKVVDAAQVLIDTPPQATCSFAMTDMGSLGLALQNGDPIPDDPTNADPNMKFSWIEVYQNAMDPNDPLNGRKQLLFGAGIPPAPTLPFNDAVEDTLVVKVFANDAGVFIINNATNFNTDLTADTYAAETYILGNVQGNNFQNFYYSSSGAITLTSVNETAGSNGGLIEGSVSATVYTEYDDQNAVVSTGCMPSLGGMTFKLKTLATANGKPSMANTNRVEEIRAMIKRADALMAQQKH